MSLVQTVFGLVPRQYLEVKDIIEEGDNFRSIATEWRLTEDLSLDGKTVEFTFDTGQVIRSVKGAMCKRSVTVEILASPEANSQQGVLNGGN